MNSKCFLGIARTSYQLLNILAVYETGKSYLSNTEIVFCPYWGNAVLNADLISYCESQKIKIIYLDSFDLDKTISSKVKYHKGEIEIVTASLSMMNWLKVGLNKINQRIKIILIDDGVGSYSGFVARFRALSREKNNFFYRILFPFYYFSQKLMIHFFGERFQMLKQNDWGVNRVYRNSLLNLISKLPTNKKNINSEIVVFCTQPYVDMNAISNEEYSSVLNSVKEYCTKTGCELLIRKHPADTIFDYNGFQICESKELFESFVLNNVEKIKSTISIDSTCLLTSSALFGIESYRVNCSISRANSDGFNPELKRIFKKHTKWLQIDNCGD